MPQSRSKLPALLLRERDVANLVGAHRSTIRRWMRKGEFPLAVRLPGRRVAWLAAEVVAWAEARERAQ